MDFFVATGIAKLACRYLEHAVRPQKAAARNAAGNLEAQLQAITTTSRRCSCGMVKAPVSDPATELVLDAPLVYGTDLKDLVAAASLPSDSRR